MSDNAPPAAAPLQFGLLGPVEARRNGRPLQLGGIRQRALLALLLLRAGEVVPRGRLIDELFGEAAGDGAANALQAVVSRLRTALQDGREHGRQGVLATRAGGYVLQVDASSVDLGRFEALREEGRRALAGGDVAVAAKKLREAMGLWRGPPLADLTELDALQSEIRRLEELRLVTEMDRLDAELGLGRGSDLVAELETLVDAHPLQERLRGQLMLALYRSGRQADALAAYRQTRELLADELGLEPSRALQDLERRILVQDASLDVPAQRRVAVCPFKGLGWFDVDDAEFFAGREAIVQELVSRLAESTFVGVVGPSGIGKSSIVRAGLLHALASGALPGSDRWPIHVIRPGSKAPGSVRTLVDSAPPGGRIVIAVDQLEEVFTMVSDGAAQAVFLRELSEAANDPQRRAVVAVALRADFYGRCASHPAFASLLARDHLLVGPMEEDDLSRAVTVPAERAGLTVEPGLVRALVADVDAQPGALPLLSTALLELWRRRDGPLLRLRDYREAGGVQGAVARLGEGTYESLDAPERELARLMMLQLAAGEADAAERRRRPAAELTRGGDERAARVLETLVDARLLTVDDGAVEVAHEALLREWPRMRGWLADESESRRLHARLTAAAREWADGGRDTADLYRGPRLSAVLDWEAAHPDEPAELERAFLAASRDAADEELVAQKRRNRRLRALVAWIGALLLLTVLAGAAALVQRAHARTAARVALAGKLGAEAVTEPRIDRAMLLAREAVALDPAPQTEGTLLATLLRSPTAIATLTSPITSRPLSLAVSPDGGTLAVSDNSGVVRFYDVATRGVRLSVPHAGFGNPVAYTADGSAVIAQGGVRKPEIDVRNARTLQLERRLHFDRRFLTQNTNSASPIVSGTGTVVFAYSPIRPDGSDAQAYVDRWSLTTGKRISAAIPVAVHGATRLSFVDGDRRLVLVGDNAAAVLDASSLRLLRRVPIAAGRPRPPTAVTPDGRTLAVGGPAGTVSLVDMATGNRRTLAGGHTAGVVAAEFSGDGRTLVTTGEDGSVIVWDRHSGSAIERLAGHATRALGIAISRDGRTLYTSSLDGAIFVWDLGSARRFGLPLTTIPSRQAPVGIGSDEQGTPPLALEPGGARFAVRVARTRVGIFSVATGRALERFDVALGSLAGLAWSRSGRLAVSGEAGRVQLWDVPRQGRPSLIRRLRGLRSVTGRPETVTTLAFSPSGGLLAGGDVNHTPYVVPWRYGTVAIWDAASGRLLWKARSKRGWVTSVSFSPDGQKVAAGDESGAVVVYSASSGRELGRVKVEGGGDLTYLAVGWTRDGTLLTGSWSGIVQRWDAHRFRELGKPTLVAAAPVASLAVDPVDAMFATTGGSDGLAKLWTTASVQELGSSFTGPRAEWSNAAFTSDGSRLVVVYENGTGAVWPTSLAAWEQHACNVAGRNFTHEEWRRFVGGEPYRATCPRQPAVSGS